MLRLHRIARQEVNFVVKKDARRRLFYLFPAQNHLAGLTRAHGIEALLEVVNAETVSDNR